MYTADTLDQDLADTIKNPYQFKLSAALRWHIDKYLGNIEPGSTFLDVGCHIGYSYHILLNEMKLDIKYHGIDIDADLISLCTRHFGPYFEYRNLFDVTDKYDYVWCVQFSRMDNPKILRHLAGITNKRLIYSHTLAHEGGPGEDYSIKIHKSDRFEVIVI